MCLVRYLSGKLYSKLSMVTFSGVIYFCSCNVICILFFLNFLWDIHITKNSEAAPILEKAKYVDNISERIICSFEGLLLSTHIQQLLLGEDSNPLSMRLSINKLIGVGGSVFSFRTSRDGGWR